MGPKSKRAAGVTTIVISWLLLTASHAWALSATVAEIHITSLAFTKTGQIKVEMSYSCLSGAQPDADEGTILVVAQDQADGTGVSSRRIDFSDQLMCDEQWRTIDVRVHHAGAFDRSDPIRAIVNISLTDDFGRSLAAEDAKTMQPKPLARETTILANANVRRVDLTHAGGVRAEFSYACPLRYVPVRKSSRLFITQNTSSGQLVAIRRIARLVQCDGTRNSVTVRVHRSREGERFSAALIHASVDITVARPNGATALLGNGKTFAPEFRL